MWWSCEAAGGPVFGVAAFDAAGLRPTCVHTCCVKQQLMYLTCTGQVVEVVGRFLEQAAFDAARLRRTHSKVGAIILVRYACSNRCGHSLSALCASVLFCMPGLYSC
jgi:hypothetical protein